MHHYLHTMPATRTSRRKLIMLTIFALFLVPLVARAALYAAGDGPRSWRDADWSSTGLLPGASDYEPARVIVFTGKAGAWKGIFAVHSWIVFKPANAAEWTRYDVVGWVEGVELDLLGLVAGLDLRHPGVKLPGFGRIGVESPVATALAL
jgi:hypothetical protein